VAARTPTRLTAEWLEAREVPAADSGGAAAEPLALPPDDYKARSDAMVKAFPAAPVVRSLAVGYQDANDPASWRVRLYQDLAHYQDFEAYHISFTASVVRVAVGDVTGDGVPDVVTALGGVRAPAGTRTEVKVFDGRSLGTPNPAPLRAVRTDLLSSYVTTGDFDRDGHADVVVSHAEGSFPEVTVFSGAEVANPAVTTLTRMADFDPIGDPHFTGGASVAVGDVNGDGTPDLVCGAGVGGGPRVAVWDGTTLRTGRSAARLCNDFFALDPASRTGIHVAVADVNRDGSGDILAAPQSGAPQMTATDGADLLRGTLTLRWSRTYGDPASTGGLRLAVRDLDGDGVWDLALSHADKPRVTTVRGQFLAPDGTVFSAGKFEPGTTAGGVWVG
jgi:FG-GAP-like repeat